MMIFLQIDLKIFFHIDIKNVCFLRVILYIDLKIDVITILDKHVNQIIEINIKTIRSTKQSKNEMFTRIMWNLIRSIEVFRLIEWIEKLLSMSNLNFNTSSLFKLMLLIKRFKIVYYSMFFDDRIATSWSINKFLNSRSSYLNSIKTLNVYEIETASAKMMISLEIIWCLKVLLASILMIVFESFNDSSEIKKYFVFDSLNVWECSLNLIIKVLIEMSSKKASIDNFSKY
jgi:hypothetical protein